MRAASWAIALAACGASPTTPPVVAVAPAPAVVVVPSDQPASPFGGAAARRQAPVVDAAVDAGPVGVAAALAKLTELTEAMCRCGNSACASRLAEDFRTWGQGLGQTMGHSEDHVAPDEAQQQELAELSQRLTVCMTDAMTRPAGAEPR
jgi:hypothetical protein